MEIILSIAAGVIAIALTVIGFFLSKIYEKIEKTHDFTTAQTGLNHGFRKDIDRIDTKLEQHIQGHI